MYLLDTNHCSALIFGDSIIIDHAKSVGESNLAISAITEGELLYMAENSQKIAENLMIIEDFIADISIYDIDDKVSHIYAKLKAKIMNKFAPKARNKRRKTKITDLGIGENAKFPNDIKKYPINIHKKIINENPVHPQILDILILTKKLPENPYPKRLSTPFPFPAIAFLLFVLE